ncbi:hypothetical protein N7526_004382 [Penicillium atrosanguineum]|nr:hypothetical protein N7526_004382 [Penicillium atrosanguineum]
MSAVSQAQADRVLRLKSREREAHACYPCKKRKVKCDGTQPCRTCQKRKHPEICTYALPQRRRSVSRQSIAARSASPASPPANLNYEETRPEDNSKNYVYSGDNSVVSILRLRTSDANESVAREVGSVLGLQNTFNNYPFMDSKTPLERWRSLLSVLPQRSEVLKFFHYYQVTAYPFNPILAEMDRFESDLCKYLNAHAAGELRDPERITDRWATDKSIGHVSLLLATLAAGAHYSDLEYPQRLELSTDFARRSFNALRLANFLFRPSLDIIQALLILGNTMQNMGQSDAAWALLGTTVRTHALLCRLGLDIMRPENLGVVEGDRALEGLQRLDDAHKRGLPYLRSRENCTTLQQNLEYLAFRMHTSFCVSVLCRPAMRKATSQPPFPHADILRARAKGSLIDASKAFLDFQALSIVPLRSWSMVHTVLSSTLLLCIWEETRNDPECRSLQQRVIDVFLSTDSRTSDDGASINEGDGQWLSTRHIRALVTLRSALEREEEAGAAEAVNWAEITQSMLPQFGAGPDGLMDLQDPFDFSPVTYLDSIMNVPMFDYTQESEFL